MHLVLGNRDINKMRLVAELHPDNWLDAEEHPGVYWRKEALTDAEGVRRPATPATWLAKQPEGSRDDTRASRLRHMLEDNMGAPRAWELRRRELSSEGAAASDEDVLASYEASIQRGGLMRELLCQSQLAVLIGSTLFVHGAIHPGAIGVVPGGAVAPRRPISVAEWVESLNQFSREQVAEWCAAADSGRGAEWSTDDRWRRGFFERPGGRLMAYGMARQPDGELSPTVVYASFLDNGQPLAASEVCVCAPLPFYLSYSYSSSS